MFSTFAAKLGALAITPFLVFGAHGQVAPSATAHTDTTRYAQAAADERTDTSASWTKAESSCTTLEHSLSFGSQDRNTDKEVSELQAFLRAEGYLRSQPTGFFGLSTLRAVREFQSAEGIRVTGTVNDETRTKIEAVSCGSSTDLAITGISAPTSLAIGETGTWTVNVESQAEGNLRYSVVWGDERTRRMAASDAEATQSSASFTHAYSASGTYAPKFTVTDADGTTVTKAAASVTVADDASVEIASLSATSGYAGDRVTVSGSGFTDDTDVYVGSTLVTDATVSSSTSITFTVPSIGAGSYDVYVENENGTSNAIRFELKATEAVRISVSGIDAPVRLVVDQEGTWTVHADTNVSGTLHYSVVWGDEGMLKRMFGAQTTTQTSSSFTHRYSKEGTYMPTFTVSDGMGHDSIVRASVVVTK